MARTLRLSRRPTFAQVVDAVNQLPAFSTFSFDGHANDSGTTADVTTIGFNVASSQTTILWLKVSGSTTTGWQAFTLA
jgi:hypothetical protein